MTTRVLTWAKEKIKLAFPEMGKKIEKSIFRLRERVKSGFECSSFEGLLDGQGEIFSKQWIHVLRMIRFQDYRQIKVTLLVFA